MYLKGLCFSILIPVNEMCCGKLKKNPHHPPPRPPHTHTPDDGDTDIKATHKEFEPNSFLKFESGQRQSFQINISCNNYSKYVGHTKKLNIASRYLFQLHPLKVRLFSSMVHLLIGGIEVAVDLYLGCLIFVHVR